MEAETTRTMPDNDEDEDAAISWLREHAFSIQHVEAGNGFADLQPLKALLKDVKVIGLGETTHGTREFFQIKHRLLEFLVTEMDFSAFALEASYAACQPINDFVLRGTGDLATVLTGQGYVPWDMEEFAALVSWLRAHNMRVPAEKQVKFYGVDLWRNDLGRKAVLDYLRSINSDRLLTTQALFDALAKEEVKWPTRIDEATQMTLGQLLPQVEDLISYLAGNQAEWVSRSSPAEFDNALQSTHAMRQWLIANTPDSFHPAQPKSNARSLFMGKNIEYLIDRDRPEAKYVTWAHNGHISLDGVGTAETNWGAHLRERFGHGYFALGFEFNQGSCLTRIVAPGEGLADLKEVSFSPAPTGSWPWYLTQLNMGDLILNLRPSVESPVIEQWLSAPRRMRSVNWGYDEKSHYGGDVNIVKKYDGVLFIERTTPTHPTANALATVARRAWL